MPKGEILHPFEHALKRPDAIIGCAKCTVCENWVFDDGNTIEDEVQDENSDESADNNENFENKSDAPKIVRKYLCYNCGLERIFIEIMSNAIDNKWRSESEGYKMKYIDFQIGNDPEDAENFGWITITNDGYPIPIELTKYKISNYRTGKKTVLELYPVEAFFGEMLSGTNFSDNNGEETEKRKTSGRNGMGGKATVIFSREFIVEHADPNNKKMLSMTFSNNGKVRTQPEISAYTSKIGYTKISFLPDYEYFGYPSKEEPGMTDELFSLLKKHVYDCAMITGLNVTLNGEKVTVKDLAKYARLIYPDKANKMIHLVSENSECVLLEGDPPEIDSAENVSCMSWVNGIYTKFGGIHVEMWRKAIFPSFVRFFNSRKKRGQEVQLKTTERELYPYFILFVRAETENQSFDSQTKDYLNGPEENFQVPKTKEFKEQIEACTKSMSKWNFMTLLEEKLLFKLERSGSKKDNVSRKKMSFGANVDEANEAGKKRSSECTLYITEGLSAKAFVKGMIPKLEGTFDLNGIAAIKGKFINVRKMSIRKVNENKEVQMLKALLGLATGIDYSLEENRKMLRYGRICLMTDQDDDGFHIRGLLLNFFYTFWPSLFSLDVGEGRSFIESFTTAVVIVEKGKGKKKTRTLFYTNPEFRAWQNNVDSKELKNVTINYYKGLGTHEKGEEKVYLDDPKSINYILDGKEAKYIELGFGKDKKQIDLRKRWIIRDLIKPGEKPILLLDDRVDTDENNDENENKNIIISGNLSISTFTNDYLKIYWLTSIERAIPNLYDGLKEGQRKVIFGIMNDPKARRGPVNVENLSGSIKSITSYHHGAVSLVETLVKLAQRFVGSNNIPLLVAKGQFGTREVGGSDHSAARYIKTCLEKIVWTIFREEDNPLLENKYEDNEQVEYHHFMPIIPMILVNGADGIAAGFATTIPCYNPLDLVQWITKWINAKKKCKDGEIIVKHKELVPWYNNFKGTIELVKNEDGAARSWISTGLLEQRFKKNGNPSGWWDIHELPIGLWTADMKNHLDYLRTGIPSEKSKKKKTERLLSADWKQHNTTDTIHFEIKPTKEYIPDINVKGNMSILKKGSHLTNMIVLDENGYPRKFESPEEILYAYCPVRLYYYQKRRQWWLEEWGKQLFKEQNKLLFVKLVAIEKKLDLHQSNEKLEKRMIQLKLEKINDSFDYLLSMQARSFTQSKVEELQREIDKLQAKIDDLTNKSEYDLWISDLEEFKEEYAKYLRDNVPE